MHKGLARLASAGAVALLLLTTSAAFAQDFKDCKAGTALDVEWKGSWYKAKIVKGPNDNGACFIHYDGYADSWDEWASAKRMRAADQACPVGEKVLVSWKKSWYEAEVTGGPKDGNTCLIHYKGYDNSWDEHVGPDRAKRKSGAGNGRCVKDAKIMVNWKGTWYPAAILKDANEKGECFIHYDGFESSWDEWVGADRIW